MSGQTDPKVAIALRYAWGERAPEVVASGREALAERIVDAAVAHGVPVHEDAALADLLARVPVGTAIPPAAFLAVAQVLSFLVEADAMVGADQAFTGSGDAATSTSRRSRSM